MFPVATMKPSLSIVIPCYNEEGNVENTVTETLSALDGIIENYEIIIINDASNDKTGEVIDRLAVRHSNIRCIHNEKNRGLGYNYYAGVSASSKDYVITVFGDNEVVRESLRNIFMSIGRADIILAYIANRQLRPVHRQILSRGFTLLVNLISGHNIKYYNGPVVHKRENVLKLSTRSHGFAYMAEITTALLKHGHKYYELPFHIQPRAYGTANALRIRNVISVTKTLWLIALRQLGLIQ